MNRIFNPAWVIMGPIESWKTAFLQNGIWGVRLLLYPEWKALDTNDRIFFFVTKTVKGIIGVGRVGNKFIQDKPLWPDEIESGNVIYPYRFEFDIDYLIEENRWEKERISSREVPLTIQEMRRGINFLQDETHKKLINVFKKRFNFDLPLKEDQKITKIEIPKIKIPSTSHSNLQQIIFQIGKMNRLIAEKEYPMESERLDVVWRRVEKSVPTYVFEIQVGGDIYHALGKLKHAYDLWNSNICIVASHEDHEKIDHLLEGTFHEIQRKIKKISIEQISELFQQKSKWVDLEREIGLL